MSAACGQQDIKPSKLRRCRRQNFSVYASVSRENVPASTTLMAISIAATGVGASRVVTNCSRFLRPTARNGFPFARQMRARHRPGLCSSDFITNCLYSMDTPHEFSPSVEIETDDQSRRLASRFERFVASAPADARSCTGLAQPPAGSCTRQQLKRVCGDQRLPVGRIDPFGFCFGQILERSGHPVHPVGMVLLD